MPRPPDDIERRFRYHAPDPARRLQHDAARDEVFSIAEWLDGALPDSREKSLAMTKLEEMSFWVHADIARRQYDEENA